VAERPNSTIQYSQYHNNVIAAMFGIPCEFKEGSVSQNTTLHNNGTNLNAVLDLIAEHECQREGITLIKNMGRMEWYATFIYAIHYRPDIVKALLDSTLYKHFIQANIKCHIYIMERVIIEAALLRRTHLAEHLFKTVLQDAQAQYRILHEIVSNRINAPCTEALFHSYCNSTDAAADSVTHANNTGFLLSTIIQDHDFYEIEILKMLTHRAESRFIITAVHKAIKDNKEYFLTFFLSECRPEIITQGIDQIMTLIETEQREFQRSKAQLIALSTLLDPDPTRVEQHTTEVKQEYYSLLTRLNRAILALDHIERAKPEHSEHAHSARAILETQLKSLAAEDHTTRLHTQRFSQIQRPILSTSI
jgi:hypothetical protein